MPKQSPFTLEQRTHIISSWNKSKSLTAVRRQFAKDFGLSKHPRKVPDNRYFKDVIDKFHLTGSVNNKSPPGRPKSARTQENIDKVRQLVTSNHGQSMSVRDISKALDLQISSVWKILRLDLKLFPYKPKTTVSLTEQQKADQVEFEDRVISRKTQIPWPTKSPDLAPNDYWLWSICLGEISRVNQT